MSIVPGMLSTAQGDVPVKPDTTQQMREQAQGKVKVSYNKATGKVSFVRVGRRGDLLPGSRASARGKADAFLRTYAEAFGAPRSQLVSAGSSFTRYGTTLKYAQIYRGVPVFGTQLLAHFDRAGHLQAVNGQLVPVGGLSLDTTLSATAAAEQAVRLVRLQPPGGADGRVSTKGLKAESSTLVVYRHGLLQGKTGNTELVYQVEVTNGKNIRDMVFISAITGKVVNRYSLIDNALYRVLYEARTNGSGKIKFHLVWNEGDRFPKNLTADQQNMILSTGEAYWFFRNAWGRDSFDDEGSPMITVNNDPRISCPNANWNGVTTNYCDGVSSDDVVAHEWAHAYTEYTNGLIYQWQSGAMNEAYSDIWGETIDLINGRQDEGESFTAKRQDGWCTTNTGAVPQVVILAPEDIKKVCPAGAASFGPQVTPAGITDNVVLGLDPAEPADAAAGLAAGTTTDGCSALTNAAEVAGNIALLDRGRCDFSVKAKNAQNAGAVAVIIANTLGRGVFGMSGSDPTITIPTVGISNADGDRIKSRLNPGPVTVTLRDGASANKENSTRWLIGEKSPAFGTPAAIRDMWTPTCKGDPGKVSDAEYVCDAGDSGGVHSNSGVVNHSYALMVDGGYYNGQTVNALGFTKSAHIYWRAQTEYLFPAASFTDLADGLEAACVDLTGKALTNLSTKADTRSVSNQQISAADCAEVAKVVQAVELRRDPTDQCNWQPILDPNTPALCTGTATSVLTEDFEDGLAGWSLSGTNPYGGPTMDWEASLAAPGGHTGGVAYGPAPDFGQCDGSTNDFSSVNYLTSGAVTVPASGTAKMSFDHYIATEAGFDGGNVQISISGGAFAAVPASAYTFNEPGTLSTVAEGSTNPLAGQPGFSGTDPGSPAGSWGTSQIDLSALNVAGKSIVLRFAIGRDGCGGVDGWYVDNVNVITCSTASTAARSGTKPATRGSKS
jgi:Zn-dependent metalloprotease